MDIRVNDILVMKKPHPCGEKRWLVLRTGADFRLRCLGCGHELMTPRFKAEKNIRSVERKETSDSYCRRFFVPHRRCRRKDGGAGETCGEGGTRLRPTFPGGGGILLPYRLEVMG